MALLKDGEPCGHRGCLSHLSHPCEGCGRIGGKQPIDINRLGDKDEVIIKKSGSVGVSEFRPDVLGFMIRKQ